MAVIVGSGRFVVLEHRWNGVHWDFMLEADGVLRTWAIDEPIAAGADLPARALADHRLAYLTYEGPVAGARGSVRRVAEGTYQALEWRPDEVHLRLAGAQLVGEVRLKRSGSASDSSGGSTRWTFRLGKFN